MYVKRSKQNTTIRDEQKRAGAIRMPMMISLGGEEILADGADVDSS